MYIDPKPETIRQTNKMQSEVHTNVRYFDNYDTMLTHCPIPE